MTRYACCSRSKISLRQRTVWVGFKFRVVNVGGLVSDNTIEHYLTIDPRC